jgi:hypothetical protein
MTSKLNTAGLVERLRDWHISGPLRRSFEVQKLCNEAANLIEALTQAAAPDIEPDHWFVVDGTGCWHIAYTAEERDKKMEILPASIVHPFYSASQLSAIQERAERAERERDDYRATATEHSNALIAAESRVAELTHALEIISGERPCIDNLMGNADIARAALAHKGEGR